MKMTKGVHHIALRAKGVEKFEKMVHFYRDLLGMEVVRTWGEGEGTGMMLDIGGGSVMELFATAPDEAVGGAIRHFALAVEDVDACAKVCADAGYDVFIEPKDIVIASNPPFPARITFVKGPVGEEVEFFCEK